MDEYRVYFVDTDDHFYDAVRLICADDAEAIDRAKWLAIGHGVELWQLDRKVAVFPDQKRSFVSVSYTHLTLPTNREV